MNVLIVNVSKSNLLLIIIEFWSCMVLFHRFDNFGSFRFPVPYALWSIGKIHLIQVVELCRTAWVCTGTWFTNFTDSYFEIAEGLIHLSTFPKKRIPHGCASRPFRTGPDMVLYNNMPAFFFYVRIAQSGTLRTTPSCTVSDTFDRTAPSSRPPAESGGAYEEVELRLRAHARVHVQHLRRALPRAPGRRRRSDWQRQHSTVQFRQFPAQCCAPME